MRVAIIALFLLVGIAWSTPMITIISPVTKTYNISTIDFNVSLNENGSWCGASINETVNVTMTAFSSTYFNYTKTMPNSLHNVTFYCNDTDDNMNKSALRYFAVSSLQTIAAITIISPVNTTYRKSDVDFSLSLSDGSSCDAEINGINDTMTKFNSTYFNYTKSMPDGLHSVRFYCNDTSGRMNSTELIYFTINTTVDNVYPQIYYNPSTTEEGRQSTNYILINISVIDENKDTVGYSWNNINYTILAGIGDYYWVNKTSLIDRAYTFYAWVNDSFGNMNRTEARTVNITGSNTTQDCSKASVRIDTVYLMPESKTAIVAVLNDGNLDNMEIVSAYIYMKDGRKFSSAIPIYDFDVGDIENINFKDLDISCDDFSRAGILTNCIGISVESEKAMCATEKDAVIEIENAYHSDNKVYLSIKNTGKDTVLSSELKFYVDNTERKCSSFTLQSGETKQCQIFDYSCSGRAVIKVIGPKNEDEEEFECKKEVEIAIKICADKNCRYEAITSQEGQMIYIRVDSSEQIESTTLIKPDGNTEPISIDLPIKLMTAGNYKIVVETSEGKQKEMSFNVTESPYKFLESLKFIILAVVAIVLALVYRWFKKKEESRIKEIIGRVK